MKPANDHLQTVATAYRNGLYTEAIELAQRALEENPHDGRLWELKGLAHRARGDCDSARMALEAASLLVPLYPCGNMSLADCYREAGHAALARDMYRFSATCSSVPTSLLSPLAERLDEVGEPMLALKVARDAVRRDPDDSGAVYEMGFYMARSGCPAEVVESVMRRAILLEPKCVRYRVGLGGLLHSLDRTEEAYEVLRELPMERFDGVNCACCLRKLIAIFTAVGDEQRVRECDLRLNHLVTIQKNFPTGTNSDPVPRRLPWMSSD